MEWVTLRLRILAQLTGVFDGVPLSQFETDRAYDVTDSLGAFLVASRSAEEVFVRDFAPPWTRTVVFPPPCWRVA
jgi:hypothetical protein